MVVLVFFLIFVLFVFFFFFLGFVLGAAIVFDFGQIIEGASLIDIINSDKYLTAREIVLGHLVDRVIHVV